MIDKYEYDKDIPSDVFKYRILDAVDNGFKELLGAIQKELVDDLRNEIKRNEKIREHLQNKVTDLDSKRSKLGQEVYALRCENQKLLKKIASLEFRLSYFESIITDHSNNAPKVD